MVVLVDDNNDTLDLYTLGLSLQGFRVRVASDAKEALALITLRAPKIVVTDLCMPGVDGFDLCRQLRCSEGTRRIPIVVVSADDDPVQRLALGKIGVCSVLTKPIAPEELAMAIRSLLEKQDMCATCLLQEAPLVPIRSSALRLWSKHAELRLDPAAIGRVAS
jgi:DNA-binding response OmpR family regulator